MRVILEGLSMAIETESYIDAMHAVLTHSGWISCSKPMLACMTASAFRFVIHRRLPEESHTAYNWMAEHFLAADFIGIMTSQGAGFSFDATFPLYQKEAINQIKHFINTGTGAVIWHDRFVVAAGYDDELEALLISDGTGAELKLLSYTSFGCNSTPYWFYQIFEHRITLDPVEIYKESLVQCVHRWESHDPMLPEADYGCGSAGYEALSEALEHIGHSSAALRETLRCYTAAKRNIRDYMKGLVEYWPALCEVADYYLAVTAGFDEALQKLDAAAADQNMSLDQRTKEELQALFAAAKASEEQAVEVLRLVIRETLSIRAHDIALR
ncbi:hypothetical protein [Paenibacillus pinihumi]|uniref:hypothetical protein n=1 Tax=Paenibacillus pinihumi TaxID=669462 RepID=UPI0004138860|nr:hypothetical protein [Paenibacillus pinihumi]